MRSEAGRSHRLHRVYRKMIDYGVLEQMGRGYQHCMDLVLARIMFVVGVGWIKQIADNRICVVSIGAGNQHSFLIERVGSNRRVFVGEIVRVVSQVKYIKSNV